MPQAPWPRRAAATHTHQRSRSQLAVPVMRVAAVITPFGCGAVGNAGRQVDAQAGMRAPYAPGITDCVTLRNDLAVSAQAPKERPGRLRAGAKGLCRPIRPPAMAGKALRARLHSGPMSHASPQGLIGRPWVSPASGMGPGAMGAGFHSCDPFGACRCREHFGSGSRPRRWLGRGNVAGRANRRTLHCCAPSAPGEILSRRQFDPAGMTSGGVQQRGHAVLDAACQHLEVWICGVITRDPEHNVVAVGVDRNAGADCCGDWHKRDYSSSRPADLRRAAGVDQPR